MNIIKSTKAVILFVLLCTFHNADAQSVAWSSFFGGDHQDKASSVIPLQDGGYALFGVTFSFGAGMYDYYLIKTDSLGNLEWSKTYGTAEQDQAQSFDCTSDGGYILAGYRYYSAGNLSLYVVKTDSQGIVEWEALYGTGQDLDICHSIKQTSDDGYVIAGYTDFASGGSDTDFFLIKTNELGEVLWQTYYGGENTDECYDVEISDDGGYLLSGITYPEVPGYPKYYAVKTDSEGITEWEVVIGGDEFDLCTDAIQVSDGGFVLAGFSDSFSDLYNDFYIVKLDSTGATEWEQIVDSGQDDQARHLCETSDQSLIICGNTSNATGHPQGYVAKISNSGSVIWDITCGGTDNEYLYCIEESATGEYISAGITSSYGPAGYNCWLVKIEEEVGISVGSLALIEGEGASIAVSPNPAHDSFELSYTLGQQTGVSITIYGIDGRLINSIDLGLKEQGVHSIVLNTEGPLGNQIPQGVYFIRLETEESNSSQSILILD